MVTRNLRYEHSFELGPYTAGVRLTPHQTLSAGFTLTIFANRQRQHNSLKMGVMNYASILGSVGTRTERDTRPAYVVLELCWWSKLRFRFEREFW